MLKKVIFGPNCNHVTKRRENSDLNTHIFLMRSLTKSVEQRFVRSSSAPSSLLDFRLCPSHSTPNRLHCFESWICCRPQLNPGERVDISRWLGFSPNLSSEDENISIFRTVFRSEQQTICKVRNPIILSVLYTIIRITQNTSYFTSRLLWKLNVHYIVHKSQPLNIFLNDINSAYVITLNF
jgi:hypothetical protein